MPRANIVLPVSNHCLDASVLFAVRHRATAEFAVPKETTETPRVCLRSSLKSPPAPCVQLYCVAVECKGAKNRPTTPGCRRSSPATGSIAPYLCSNPPYLCSTTRRRKPHVSSNTWARLGKKEIPLHVPQPRVQDLHPLFFNSRYERHVPVLLIAVCFSRLGFAAVDELCVRRFHLNDVTRSTIRLKHIELSFRDTQHEIVQNANPMQECRNIWNLSNPCDSASM